METPSRDVLSIRGLRAVTVGTFNAENLVSRYRFKQKNHLAAVKAGFFTRNSLAFDSKPDVEMKLTAKAILDADADILCLQEVEDGSTLDRFNRQYLRHMEYAYSLCIEAHDSRSINIGVLSRIPFGSVRTHKDEKLHPGKRDSPYIFSRDCLEVEFPSLNLVVFVNHFKAMNRGRKETSLTRFHQAQRVGEIIRKAQRRGQRVIVLGDLNDPNDQDSSIRGLTRDSGLINVLERLPPEEQWTHYYNAGDSYQQLDYILVGKDLAEGLPANRDVKPYVVRKGMPLRATRYKGVRFPDIGVDRPKSSDHCPVAIRIWFPIARDRRRRRGGRGDPEVVGEGRRLEEITRELDGYYDGGEEEEEEREEAEEDGYYRYRGDFHPQHHRLHIVRPSKPLPISGRSAPLEGASLMWSPLVDPPPPPRRASAGAEVGVEAEGDAKGEEGPLAPDEEDEWELDLRNSFEGLGEPISDIDDEGTHEISSLPRNEMRPTEERGVVSSRVSPEET